MFDPSPVVGLPEKEYMEIYNHSDLIIDLSSVTIGDASGSANLQGLVQPNSYFIIGSSISGFDASIQAIQISDLPTFANNADSMGLSISGDIADFISYQSSWYRDAAKSDGGYSLERISLAEKCLPALNWIASIDVNGGTPGEENSVWNQSFDSEAPTIESISLVDNQSISITFSEPMNFESLINSNFTITPTITIENINGVESGTTQIRVQLADPLTAGVNHDLAISNLTDCEGNLIESINFDLIIGAEPSVADLSITEIMFDPSPIVGLPEKEYIEIYNRSDLIIDLSSVTIGDASGSANLEGLVQPNSYFIIVSSISGFDASIQAIQISDLPTFANNADSIGLSISGDVADFISYQSSWYRDAAKSDGGYSLERISFEDKCLPELNWIVSLDESGGTPGEENSVWNQSFDSEAPTIESLSLVDDQSISITFSEPMDFESLINSNFTITPTITIENINGVESGATQITVQLADPLTAGVSHDLAISNLNDCEGILIETINFDLIIGAEPNAADLSITEIMFDPSPFVGLPEKEHIEIYNGSDLIIDLSSVTIGDASGSANLEGLVQPNGYFIIGSSISGFDASIQAIQISDLPTFANNADSIGLSISGDVGDFISYQSSWYRDAAKSDGGYSLERISFEDKCLPELNWIASLDESGGTPGEENSVWNQSFDSEAPMVSAYHLIDNSNLQIEFSEPMDFTTLVSSNFQVSNDLLISNIEGLTSGTKQITIQFSEVVTEGIIYDITGNSSITDCAGNGLAEQTLVFGRGAKPEYNELIITEIMADPDPVVSDLPNTEYIEIYNRSDMAIELEGISIHDASNEVPLSSMIINPSTYLLLVPNASSSSFNGIEVLGVSNWPSLSNGGESLSLMLDEILIFHTDYSDDWYKDSEKSTGGWSLEMIDYSNPCGEENNWTASTANNGGTPGLPNAAAESNPDNFGPQVIDGIIENDRLVKLTFSEKLFPAVFGENQIVISPAVDHSTIMLNSPQNNELTVSLNETLQPKTTYTVTVDNLTDCNRNIIDQNHNSVSFVLPEEATQMDLVINEVLFEPKEGGVEFVEIYNNSDKNIDLNDWRLGDKSSDMKLISGQPLIVKPYEYKVLTSNAEQLKIDYSQSDESTFVEMSSFPSFSNDQDSVILMDYTGKTIDAFEYYDDWHFSLLNSTKGVSLERISADAASDDEGNWQSAASTTGFATPGLENSQSKPEFQSAGKVTIDPKVFMPDNTGMNDYTTINYEMNNAGSFANVYIYSSTGQLVKTLAEGALLSTTGFITWDGTQDGGGRATVGYYIILFEIFDASGNKEVIKETVVLGTRF